MAKEKPAAQPSAVDPLAAASVSPASALAKAVINDDFDSTSVDPNAKTDPAQAATPPEPTLPPVGSAPPVPATKATKAYKVVRPVTVSWGYMMLRLAAGDLVSEMTHGEGAIDKLKAMGVALEECSDPPNPDPIPTESDLKKS